MPSFTAVCAVHDADYRPILNTLLQQSRIPDEILVFVSADKQAIELRHNGSNVRLFAVANRNDWGHEKRALGLRLASCEYIGWFNHDDRYAPTYIEEMLAPCAGELADVVYCDWREGQHPDIAVSEFRAGSSTAGNWIAKTDLVREAGYPGRHYSADGELINRVAAVASRVVRVPRCLYFHNP